MKNVLRTCVSWFVISVLVLLIGAGALYVKLHEATLPGLSNQLSARSELEISTLLQESPSVVGGWVLRRNYEKMENPIFFHVSKHLVVDQFLADFARIQQSGKGHSSAEISANPKNVLQNTKEAVTGEIRCIPIYNSAIIEYTPSITVHAKSICIGTLPPFQTEENIRLAIVVISTAAPRTKELDEVKRLLLQLQIDIYNRDFRGQETWERR